MTHEDLARANIMGSLSPEDQGRVIAAALKLGISVDAFILRALTHTSAEVLNLKSKKDAKRVAASNTTAIAAASL